MRTRPYLDDDQYEDLTDILQAAEENESRLTPWEVTFVDSMQNQLGQWDRRTTVSDKQWAVLNRLRKRIME